jgi:DNA-binding transcriptional ArsR family regulator
VRPSLAEIDTVFGALAHEARRQILLLLAHYGPELPSGYLAARMSHTWPTTTRHLHVLAAAGLVTVRQQGRNCVYRLEREPLERVAGGWLSLLELPSGDPTGRSVGRLSTKKGNRA